jgi:UDP-N-acetylmuramate dehydrogenase
MAELRGQIKANEPMAAHVSWRAGGSAARAFFPVDLDDLAAFLAGLRHDEPLLLVGLGSNLLVRDGGFDGTAIFTHGALNTLRREPDGSFYAEAGVASPKLARFVGRQGCAEAEFLAGIPGTVGDRHVGLKSATDEVFAAAWFRFPPGDAGLAQARMKELLERRVATQPLALPNAGSVFRNPPGDHAARLIEAAGLKGTQIDGAQVSEKHSNFIVNPDGAAAASAIEMLIGRIQAEVREKFGISLVREVRIVGAVGQGGERS